MDSRERLFSDLIDARLCVELTLARLATERLSQESLARIRECNEQRRSAVPMTHIATGYQFHLAIAEAAESAVLSFMMAAAANLYHEVLEQFERAEQSLQEEFFRRQQEGHGLVQPARTPIAVEVHIQVVGLGPQPGPSSATAKRAAAEPDGQPETCAASPCSTMPHAC